jgi:tRNA(fMet)-specific endonuclease VapC
MIRYLLDTNVISEAIKALPNKNVTLKLKIYQQEIAIASPVWHELQFGCLRLPVSRKRSMVQSFLSDVIKSTLEIIPYDEAAAEWHARQRAILTSAHPETRNFGRDQGMRKILPQAYI